MDIHEHGGDAVRAVRETRNWLANVSRRKLDSADRVAQLYETFIVDLPTIAASLDFDHNDIPYVDFERIVIGWLTPAT